MWLSSLSFLHALHSFECLFARGWQNIAAAVATVPLSQLPKQSLYCPTHVACGGYCFGLHDDVWKLWIKGQLHLL